MDMLIPPQHLHRLLKSIFIPQLTFFYQEQQPSKKEQGRKMKKKRKEDKYPDEMIKMRIEDNEKREKGAKTSETSANLSGTPPHRSSFFDPPFRFSIHQTTLHCFRMRSAKTETASIQTQRYRTTQMQLNFKYFMVYI